MSLVGKTAEVHLRVSPPDSAEAARLSPEDGFPAVLVTTRLVDIMELAAARLMRLRLLPGQASVGLDLRLTHLAAVAPGVLVRAVASAMGSQGRLHRFSINVFDETGLVASGEHTRAVVVPRRLLAGARRRAGQRSMLVSP